MIQDAAPSADGDKEAEARVDAKRAFVGYFHSLRSATEGSGDDQLLNDTLGSGYKLTITSDKGPCIRRFVA